MTRWALVLGTVFLLAPLVHADIPPPSGPPCWIRGKVYADADPKEVALRLSRSPSCPASLVPGRNGYQLVLESRRWIVRIDLPHRGGWMALDYRWLAPVATIGGQEVAVLIEARGGA